MTPREDGYYEAILNNTDRIYMRFLVAENECRFTIINTVRNTKENALDYLCNQAMRTYGGNYKCKFLAYDSFEVYEYDRFLGKDKTLIKGIVKKVYSEADNMQISFPDDKGNTGGAWVAGFTAHDFDYVTPVRK